MASGPTTGATEPVGGYWRASPGLAFAIRALVFLLPLIGAFLAVRVAGDWFYRPSGRVGVVVWLVQASALGSVVAMAVDRQSRRLLPLATLFGMSLVFPDQAPSRFSVALRTGTVRQLRRKVERARRDGLGSDLDLAATTALELVTALGDHDRFTRGHTERVRAYAELIAAEMGVSERDRALLSWGVLLHDIGKIAVPPEILNKVEPLTDAEWLILRGHPAAGARMIRPLEGWLGTWALAAGQHHERWDGKGYPHGLAATEISLAGRIASVADAYDVITSKRSYKEPMSPEAARRELVDKAGTQFDPDAVRAMLNVSLGRRWLLGPLGGLLDLWGTVGAGVGATPLVASVGALAAVTAAAVNPPPVPGPDGALAFDTGAPPVSSTAGPDEDDGESATTSTPTSAGDGAGPPTTPADPGLTAPSTTTSTVPDPTVTASTTTGPDPGVTVPPPVATTVPTPTPTTPTPTTPAPATAAPVTTLPAVTVPHPTLPVPEPTAPPAAASTYYLGRDFLTLVQPLTTSAPTDPLRDLDLLPDGIDGLTLFRADAGLSERDLGRVRRWHVFVGDRQLAGPARLRLWMATADDLGGGTITVRAGLGDCNSATYFGCPTSFAETQATVSTYVGPGPFAFQEVVLDFGTISHSFAANRHLVVTVVVEGASDAHLGYAAPTTPSRLELTEAP